MADAVRRKEVYEMDEAEKKNKPTPEEHCELTKEIIKDLYNQYKNQGHINDLFNIAYNLLRKHNLINPDKVMVDEAMKYGKEMAKKSEGLKFKIVQKENDNLVKIYARNFCVQKYFDQVNIDYLLNTIQPKDF